MPYFLKLSQAALLCLCLYHRLSLSPSLSLTHTHSPALPHSLSVCPSLSITGCAIIKFTCTWVKFCVSSAPFCAPHPSACSSNALSCFLHLPRPQPCAHQHVTNGPSGHCACPSLRHFHSINFITIFTRHSNPI